MEWPILNSKRRLIAAFSLALLLSSVIGISLQGQSAPSKLLSIPVIHPMVLNPAFVGSKDFTNISLTTKASKSPDTQILSVHKRLAASDGKYSHLGFGVYAFQEQYKLSWNSGLALSASYHYPLDDQNIHNISAGATVKGVFAVPKESAESVSDSLSTKFRPNMDFGVYYYGPHGFAGLSTTTLFGTETDDNSTLNYSNFERQYHLFGGYKFLLSKKLGIVIEPALLLSVNDETIHNPFKELVPYLKVYLKNFYLGTYVKDLDVFALFFQYQFPKFYTGVFLEFPRVGYLNDDNIIFEISLGLNLGKSDPFFKHYRHW
jgi:type IX secretion system PorP/SprF family membrane protein